MEKVYIGKNQKKKKAGMISRRYPYNPFPAKVLDIKRQSADTFTMVIDARMEHEPGQFVQLTLLGIGECPVSICSYSDKFLELTIHKVGSVTKALSGMKKGSRIYVRGPYGKGYPMAALKGKSLVIIGGGCGAAPLKGILSYVEQQRDDYKDVELFFGYRSPDDILFRNELKGWEKKFNVSISVDKTYSKTCYTGNVGFITELVKKAVIGPDNSAVFMCGPPVMMKLCIEIMKSKRFAEEQIYISAERLMYCAFGMCCHCMIKGKLTCLDGPVFRLDEIKDCFEEDH